MFTISTSIKNSRPGPSLVCAALAMTALGIWHPTAGAVPVTLQVVDAEGKAVSDAVVYAEPAADLTSVRPSKQTAVVEQKGRKFLPLVSVVQTGTPVSFPNNDTVRHHVYSFSTAKTFELKLYSGVPTHPVVFDKPGTVVIGCNIHDRMVSYIHVVDTPFHAKTDAAGKAVFDDLPSGRYVIKTWHHALPADAPAYEQALQLAASPAEISIKLNIDVKSVAR